MASDHGFVPVFICFPVSITREHDEMVSPRLEIRHLRAMMVIENPIIQKREETTMKITTVGLDLAKNVFHAVFR